VRIACFEGEIICPAYENNHSQFCIVLPGWNHPKKTRPPDKPGSGMYAWFGREGNMIQKWCW
jgi:hypothetical protein